ncbi:SDR family NAD(P)-dependent oxidoreductase [Chromobacterium sphagni]|uniref:Polyketide synthase n=1 Tax=Chromobacterium sphagni TaxID=1903179 RepID=A0ABX3CAZ2_9NEIS|nr:SDR family NAD(P)-dependent oxidoreductase [Chromobacterium sphagni]OHX19451.1 hypothetical protein BI344_18405 [Chromobacterium sphagni]
MNWNSQDTNGNDEVAELHRQIKDRRLSPAEAAQLLESVRALLRSKAEAEPSAGAIADLSDADVMEYFRQRIAAGLQLPAGRLELDEPLEKYGIDSVVVMQVTSELETVFGPLSKTLFFEYQTVDAIGRYFLNAHRPALTRLLGKSVAAPLARKSAEAPRLPPRPSPSPARSGVAPSSPVPPQPAAAERADIAIIGLNGRYPQAPDLDAFWDNLQSGRDCVGEIPAERWDYRLYFDERKGTAGKSYSKWGGFLDGVDQFDPLFFNISPREAQLMDPQERLFLQCAYQTLEDAGYTRESLAGAKVGVFVGVMYEEYPLYGGLLAGQEPLPALGGSPSSIANRVSYFCNFNGPSLALDTMCSSSLTALHIACQNLRLGECELALAGGVNVSIHPNKYLALSQGQFVSSKGRCASFGEGGDGYVPGEGVGAVLLKPLARAEADRDHIYGVIKATSINHGGRSNGYSVPNPSAQSEVIAAALERAGVAPGAVSYVEAHGTGTELGDPIEIAGLSKAFRQRGGEALLQTCAIGSVKSAIGHGESAAGIAGLTKVLLQMRHGQLAPSLHSRELNRHIDFGSTPFRVQRELQEWKRPLLTVDGVEREFPRIAGISSFGAGGANAHVIVEEYRAREAEPAASGPAVIVLSARSDEQLRRQARNLLEAIRRGGWGDDRLASLAHTLQSGREAMEERLAAVVPDMASLRERLEQACAADPDLSGWSRGTASRGRDMLSLLADDQDLQQLLRKWVAGGKLPRLAELWAQGLAFDWSCLYPAGGHPRRLSLPGYPFATKRYWGGKRVEAAVDQPAPTAARTLPALAERGGSTPSPLALPAITLSPLDRPAAAAVAEPARQEPQAAPRIDSSLLREQLRASLAQALCAEPDELDPERPFSELGLDSVVGVEWNREINKVFGLSMPTSALYDYPTLTLLAGHLRQSAAPADGAEAVGSRPEPVSRRDAAPVAPSPSIAPALTASLADALYAEVADIPPDRLFADLGVDSVIGVEWVRKINETLGVDLKATALFEHPTIRQLAAHVAAEQAAQPAAADLPERPVQVVELVEVVAAVEAGPRTAGIADGRIAIIGASGRYPDAADLDQYWRNLAAGRDSVREVPAARWDMREHYDAKVPSDGKIYCRWLGALDDVDCFDPLFFNISPAEAELTDPQHRLFLEECHQAFEDAGYSPAQLDGSNCGVYLGVMGSEYAQIVARHRRGSATGNSSAIGAGRVSYHFNLKGPAIPVDTACSSSLVAIHLAVQALQSGAVDMALAGGVSLYLLPETYVRMCEAGMLSPDGRCKAFDNGADGFVPGEGVGVVLLKRLQDAERDGDHIQGLIIGSAVNQDGKTNGITAPSMKSQRALIHDMYARNGIDPHSLGYVEAHGTGTKLGDPIELAALAAAFGDGGRRQFCALGSVKSNIGHATAAAGVAGVHKVLLCLRHRQLVPSLHFSRENEHFRFAGSPFYVNTELRPWPDAGAAPRRAGISSFGYSGTNAHVVMEEYVAPPRRAQAAGPFFVVLSARTEAQLARRAEQLLEEIRQRPLSDADLPDLAYTLQTGRAAMEYRLGVAVADIASLAGVLRDFLHGLPLPANALRGCVFSHDEPRPDAAGGSMMARWIAGHACDWDMLYPAGQRPRRIRLPGYPFLKQRCWADAAEPVGAMAPARPAEPAVGEAVQTLLPCWELCEPQALVPAEGRPSMVFLGVVHGALREELALAFPQARFLAVAPEASIDELVGVLGAPGAVEALTWLLPADAIDAADDGLHAERQAAGVRFGFRLLKALLALGYGGRPLRLNVVSWQTQSIRDEAVYPTHASVHGLVGSLAKEYPGWSVQLADLELGDPQAARRLRACLGFAADAGGDAHAWRSGNWYRQQLLPVDLPLDNTPAPFRQGGVYVVIGGAGGVGEAFSEHLIRRYQARMVWIGRRAYDAEIAARCDRLQGLGPRPLYFQADAADPAALAGACAQIRARLGAIHGLVHSAIVLQDRSLQGMDEQRFMAGLRAKVDTSVGLARAFGQAGLDFVLFFSSMQSFMKAPGQSNYAAGCAFSDAFAHRLGQAWACPVKIMNWGYWGGTGIVADASYRQRMAAMGIGSIEPEEGMAALEQLLCSPIRQLAVVKRAELAPVAAEFVEPWAGQTILAPQSAPEMETIWND